MEFKQTLTDYICEELLDDDEPVGARENLLADGMIDSLGMLRLVAFIEESFGFKVPPEHFTIENFRTIDAIESYLRDAFPDTGSAAHGD